MWWGREGGIGWGRRGRVSLTCEIFTNTLTSSALTAFHTITTTQYPSRKQIPHLLSFLFHFHSLFFPPTCPIPNIYTFSFTFFPAPRFLFLSFLPSLLPISPIFRWSLFYLTLPTRSLLIASLFSLATFPILLLINPPITFPNHFLLYQNLITAIPLLLSGYSII